MNAETKPKHSIINYFADLNEVEPTTFLDTMRKTVMPATATNEELAAFLMVAKQYRLNPILREIHAFPKKGGGIQPVVSIDGWASLINQHPTMNGMEFDVHENEPKTAFPFAITCRLFRKDRERPVEVTEYFSECFRNTEAWKTKPRTMLRHKALIQCARYAFGFAGVVDDDDDAHRMSEPRDVSPPRPAIAAREKTRVEKWATPATAVEPSDRVEKINTETGEINAGPSAADAYHLGQMAQEAGIAFTALPPEMNEPGTEKFADAWREGWKDAEQQEKLPL